jgi:c-di-GMP-binding flagellar brake protein YcgR
MGTDQRHAPRYPYRSALELELELAGITRPQRTVAVNLSAGGVCFEHREALRPQTRVRLRFLTDDPFDVTAQVRYSTRVQTSIGDEQTGAVSLVGVQFVGLTGPQQEKLETLVEELAARDDE